MSTAFKSHWCKGETQIILLLNYMYPSVDGFPCYFFGHQGISFQWSGQHQKLPCMEPTALNQMSGPMESYWLRLSPKECCRIQVGIKTKTRPTFIEQLKQQILLTNFLLSKKDQDAIHRLYRITEPGSSKSFTHIAVWVKWNNILYPWCKFDIY